jgi:acetyl-CoA carboxylase biotin carboxyl carrier protein
VANEEKKPSADSPQLDVVRKLLDIMKEHDLCEAEIEEEGRRVRLRKAGAVAPAAALPPVVQAAANGPVNGPAPLAATPEAPAAPAAESGFQIIASPMVGTFYRASAPDADVYTDVGDAIEPGKILCIIEAMKVMNEVKAEIEGEIVEILARNSEAVEYGQPLFKVKLKKG